MVEQLLEIIFTLFTLNVPDELPAPADVELVAPAAAPPLTLPVALPDAAPPGLDELLASDPLIRT